MPQLEETLSDANARIDAFLTAGQPVLRPLLDALARVAPLLPCQHPTPLQRVALQQYRKNLEALQESIPQLKERLLARRAVLTAKQRGLNAARAYQTSARL
jgi:hypothetical protein